MNSKTSYQISLIALSNKKYFQLQARARSQEKGTASKRAELLAENPILPNTKVGSKVKEFLTEKAPVNSKKEKKGMYTRV